MKKFRETKIGKFLTKPAIVKAISAVPIVGSFASVILNQVNESAAGQVDKKTFWPVVIRSAIGATLAYLVWSGKMTPDEAETAQGIISQ